jgi:hypothetical protein
MPYLINFNMVEQVERPENSEPQSAPPDTVDAQNEWLESRTQLGAYPEQESPLTVKPELQAKGLDAAGIEVKDARLRELKEARVQVVVGIDGLALRAGARALQDFETPADFSKIDLGMDLGPVTASIALPPATLFHPGGEPGIPEYTLALNQGLLRGNFTLIPTPDGVRVFKGELKTDVVTFKLEGNQAGTDEVRVTALSAKAPIDLGLGTLTVEAGANLASGERKVFAEYRVAF